MKQSIDNQLESAVFPRREITEQSEFIFIYPRDYVLLQIKRILTEEDSSQRLVKEHWEGYIEMDAQINRN